MQLPFSPMVQLIIGIGLWLLAGIFVASWVHRDAQRRKMKATFWATFGFFLHVVALVIYLIARPGRSKLVCPQCGREMLPSWDSCPFCGPQQSSTGGVNIEPLTEEIPARGAKVQPAKGSQEPLAETVAVGQEPPQRGQTVKLQTSEPVLAWLIVKQGKRIGKEFRLLPDLTSIGNDASNDIVIDDESVSRQHAKVRIEEERFMIYDLVSTNGTFVNSTQTSQHELQDGDEVQIGETHLVFKKI